MCWNGQGLLPYVKQMMRVNWRMMVFQCGLQYLFFIIMWLEFLLYTGRSKVPMTDVNIDIITKWPELLHDRFTIYRHVKNALMLTLIVTYQRTFRASMFFWNCFTVPVLGSEGCSVHTNSFEVHKGESWCLVGSKFKGD